MAHGRRAVTQLVCPFCRCLLRVPADRGALVDCALCSSHLVVRADVAGHSLHRVPTIVDASTVELALDHLRP